MVSYRRYSTVRSYFRQIPRELQFWLDAFFWVPVAVCATLIALKITGHIR